MVHQTSIYSVKPLGGDMVFLFEAITLEQPVLLSYSGEVLYEGMEVSIVSQ